MTLTPFHSTHTRIVTQNQRIFSWKWFNQRQYRFTKCAVECASKGEIKFYSFILWEKKSQFIWTCKKFPVSSQHFENRQYCMMLNNLYEFLCLICPILWLLCLVHPMLVFFLHHESPWQIRQNIATELQENWLKSEEWGKIFDQSK